jgi:hypothetical protein
MPKFILAYHGGSKPTADAECTDHMQKWQAWVTSLGENAINPGTPLGESQMVSASVMSEDDVKSPMMGYSIVRAPSIDAALKIAQSCPHLDLGGTLEVAEIIE